MRKDLLLPDGECGFAERKLVVSQEFRLGKYPKQLTVAPDVLNTLRALGVPEEGSVGHMHGVSLLSVDTVESLLVARRRCALGSVPFYLRLRKSPPRMNASATLTAERSSCSRSSSRSSKRIPRRLLTLYRRGTARLPSRSQQRLSSAPTRPAFRLPPSLTFSESSCVCWQPSSDLPLAAIHCSLRQGQLIFKTGSQLQLFPLYLLVRSLFFPAGGRFCGSRQAPTPPCCLCLRRTALHRILLAKAHPKASSSPRRRLLPLSRNAPHLSRLCSAFAPSAIRLPGSAGEPRPPALPPVRGLPRPRRLAPPEGARNFDLRDALSAQPPLWAIARYAKPPRGGAEVLRGGRVLLRHGARRARPHGATTRRHALSSGECV